MKARTRTIVCPRCRRAYPMSVSLGELSKVRTHVVCARCGARIDLSEQTAHAELEVRPSARVDDEAAADPRAERRLQPRRKATEASSAPRRRSHAAEVGGVASAEAPPPRETPRRPPQAPPATPRFTLAAVDAEPAGAAEPGASDAAAPDEAAPRASWLALVGPELAELGDDLPRGARLLEALLGLRDE